MKLAKVHATEFQSIRDSNEFEVGDITCLVGKNEAGKTALLQAVYRLNPVVAAHATFDVTDDYPRTDVEDYRIAVEEGERDHATVVKATFLLEDAELEEIRTEFGADAIPSPYLILSRGYDNIINWRFEAEEARAVGHLLRDANLPGEELKSLKSCATLSAASEALESFENSDEVNRLQALIDPIKEAGLRRYIYDNYLSKKVPKFLYFDEYHQMRGCENIQALKRRLAEDDLLPSDQPMLGLIYLARLDLDDLLHPERTQELINRIEGAGNHLGKKVLQYWTQNLHLKTKFDVRPALPGDPEGMRSGTNIWAQIFDSRHMATTTLGSRSRGFVWFFSFLAWYSKLQREHENLILLLDEPGLTLHGKAQEDLLGYFESEVKGRHQLIYTTHSPFMVDPTRFERVRIVQDKGIDTREHIPESEDGTKVLDDVLDASGDSLFPLQGALGYEIYQTLFVGPNSLVVEGVSDLIYIQTMSAFLGSVGRLGLSTKWTITPVGGADKVPTFVAMLGAQKGLRIATLLDVQEKDRQLIENLYKRKLIKKANVLTYADFTGGTEADVEDMFEVSFYLRLVNAEFAPTLTAQIKSSDLTAKNPRVLERLGKYFGSNPMKKGAKFNHFRPARYLSEKIGAEGSKLSVETLDRFEAAFEKLNALLSK